MSAPDARGEALYERLLRRVEHEAYCDPVVTDCICDRPALLAALRAALAAAVPAKLREPTPSMISAGLFALWGAPIPSRNGMEVQDALTDTGRIEVPRDEWWEIVATVLRAGLRAESAAVPAGPEERLTETEVKAVRAFWEYGATRGNHNNEEKWGLIPGPLTPFIADMSAAVQKLVRGSVPGGSPTQERG